MSQKVGCQPNLSLDQFQGKLFVDSTSINRNIKKKKKREKRFVRKGAGKHGKHWTPCWFQDTSNYIHFMLAEACASVWI